MLGYCRSFLADQLEGSNLVVVAAEVVEAVGNSADIDLSLLASIHTSDIEGLTVEVSIVADPNCLSQLHTEIVAGVSYGMIQVSFGVEEIVSTVVDQLVEVDYT